MTVTKLLSGSEKTQLNPENVAIVCLGMGFSGKADYESEETKGFNRGDKFVVKVGRANSLWKLLMDIKEQNTHQNIDFWIHEQLKLLVPEEYLER